MVLPLITPTLSVSPAGAGTIAAVAGTAGEDPDWPSGHSQYQDYTYTATPAAGYRFVKFEITQVISERYSGTRTDGPPTTYDTTDNPYDPSQAFASVPDRAGTVWSYDYNFPGSGFEPYDINDWISSLSVVAVFERIPRVPTHLLVNSATLGSPVRLVHDPDTHLLVADY